MQPESALTPEMVHLARFGTILDGWLPPAAFSESKENRAQGISRH
jgi:hypothetical protein